MLILLFISLPFPFLLTTGHLKLSAYWNVGLLTVHVIQARCLSSAWNSDCDSYVKMSLVPDDSRRTRCKTHLVPASNSPVFDEKFSLEILEEDRKKRLLISMWHKDPHTGPSCCSVLYITEPLTSVPCVESLVVDGWSVTLSTRRFCVCFPCSSLDVLATSSVELLVSDVKVLTNTSSSRYDAGCPHNQNHLALPPILFGLSQNLSPANRPECVHHVTPGLENPSQPATRESTPLTMSLFRHLLCHREPAEGMLLTCSEKHWGQASNCSHLFCLITKFCFRDCAFTIAFGDLILSLFDLGDVEVIRTSFSGRLRRR
ncbi:hypothetical protein RRG08_055080 [Elysia crispata]|uniref:C2 domain-containing protein n=1 Tax=Elysia crispata TaxID=231223 RepID=A0AAE1E7A7_9GAST|nr:hypothetical protein RRG08_055080 [Elysia crispata]